MIPASVSLSFTLRCANTAERIEVLLRMEILGDPRNIVLYRISDFPTDSCGYRQITLATCSILIFYGIEQTLFRRDVVC